MNKQIQFIRQKCIDANPEIVRLTDGCKVRIKDFGTAEYSGHWINPKSPIHHENSGYYVVKHGMGWDGHYAESRCINIYNDGEKQTNPHIEILGRPIRLADVLLAIDIEEPNNLCLSTEGQFMEYDPEEGTMVLRNVFWNLRKDSLEDQSEETISFIAGLLNSALKSSELSG